MQTKICKLCNTEKPVDEFHRQPKGALGRHSYCAKCYNARYRGKDRKKYPKEQKRDWQLRHRYGLSAADVQTLLDSQGGTCAICRKAPKRPCVDHCHKTGKVRGVLCHRCNIFAAAFDDESYRIQAMEYLGLC